MKDFPEELLELAVTFVRQLRENDKIEKFPSVRASIGLYERAQANAKLNGRDTVELKDITASIDSVISHRIRLAPSVKYLKTPQEFISEQYESYTERERAAEKFGGSL